MDIQDIVKSIKRNIGPNVSMKKLTSSVNALVRLGYSKKEIIRELTKFQRPKKPKSRKTPHASNLDCERHEGKPRDISNDMRKFQKFMDDDVSYIADHITEDPDITHREME